MAETLAEERKEPGKELHSNAEKAAGTPHRLLPATSPQVSSRCRAAKLVLGWVWAEEALRLRASLFLQLYYAGTNSNPSAPLLRVESQPSPPCSFALLLFEHIYHDGLLIPVSSRGQVESSPHEIQVPCPQPSTQLGSFSGLLTIRRNSTLGVKARIQDSPESHSLLATRWAEMNKARFMPQGSIVLFPEGQNWVLNYCNKIDRIRTK